MSGDFPKLLVATEFPPNASGGGPAVVRQMLKGWPIDRLFWWSCLPERDHYFGQKTAAQRVAVIPPKLYPNRRARMLKSWLLEQLWARWAARHFRETLRVFRPDVVWVIAHGWSIPPLARVLPAAHTAFHVSIHDYMDSRSAVFRWGAERSWRMAAMADELYMNAVSRGAICEPMVVDLRARTHYEGLVVHAGIEEEDFAYLAQEPKPHPERLRIAYAGTIIVEEAFALFVAALAQIRKRLPVPVAMDFFGTDTYRSRSWFEPSWMEEHGNLSAPALAKALRECTWGFAVMSLTDDDPRYNRFSFPTKFISYLAAGLPVITLGHRESSVVKMAEGYGVGLCTTTADPEKLGVALLAALAQPEAAIIYRPAILRCVTAEFDARRMRAVLHNCFHECARNTP